MPITPDLMATYFHCFSLERAGLFSYTNTVNLKAIRPQVENLSEGMNWWWSSNPAVWTPLAVNDNLFISYTEGRKEIRLCFIADLFRMVNQSYVWIMVFLLGLTTFASKNLCPVSFSPLIELKLHTDNSVVQVPFLTCRIEKCNKIWYFLNT